MTGLKGVGFLFAFLCIHTALAAIQDWTQVRSNVIAKGKILVVKNKDDATLFMVTEDHQKTIQDPKIAMRAYCESSLHKVETTSHHFDIKNGTCEYVVKKTKINHLAFYNKDKISIVTFDAKSNDAPKKSKELMQLLLEGKIL